MTDDKDGIEVIKLEKKNKLSGDVQDFLDNIDRRDSRKENVRNIMERFLFFSVLMIYMEITFHILVFKGIDLHAILMIILCFPLAAFFGFLTNLVKGKAAKIIAIVISSISIIYYVVNLIYHSIFKVFFSVAYIDPDNGQVAQYYKEIIQGLKDNILGLVFLVVIPVIFLIFAMKKFLKMNKGKKRFLLVYPGIIAVCVLVICVITPLYGKDEYSAYDLMKNVNINEFSVEKIGVIATTQIEVRNLIIPRKVEDDVFEVWTYQGDNKIPEQSVSVNDVSQNSDDGTHVGIRIIDRSPNILNINFVSMAEKETNEEVKKIDNYFASVEPTNKNEYTGMFEGYNLILITAEAFSPYCVDETLTPTLYKLTHEGFIFNNFYTPVWGGSTSDGEFVESTSLVPAKGGAKNFRLTGQNAMPFGMGNMFNMKYGITSYAFHDHTYTYYKRHLTYPNMGYYYQGLGNGMDVSPTWPESDVEMMDISVPQYIDDDLFHVYYMTVSGHLNYSFEGNKMSVKHKDEVADLPYSDACKAYIACNMELDKALENLITQLEEKGIADRTVIAMGADHYPYGLTNEQISELAGHEIEPNFELYKNNFVLWSGSIKEPIEINKYCCSMDIVPTLMNLFGFDYDSRLLMGRDILSDSEGFIIFLNRSIITDRMMYNSKTKEVTNLTDTELPEDYLKTCIKTLNNRWTYSEKIIDYNYYKYICDELGMTIPVVEQNYEMDFTTD